MSAKIRFVLLGAGNIGAKYAAALTNIEGAELVGVVSRTEGGAEAFARANSISFAARSLAEMVKRTRFDAVIVATPSGSHSACAVEAAGLGKHVLCEKPLDITLEKIDAMTEACRQAGVKLGCMFQHRVYEHNLMARQAIQEGRLGRIYIANAYLKNWRSQEYYESSGGWRGTWQLDGGGPFMQQAAHTVDLMVWMMGRAAWVMASTRTVAHRIEVEDVGHAIVGYENGAQGVLEATTAIKPGYPNKIEIHGENGTILLTESGIVAWDVEGMEPPKAEGAAGSGASNPMAIGLRGHERILRDFVGAIAEGREPMVRPQSARLSVELILAIYQSAASDGKRIALPPGS